MSIQRTILIALAAGSIATAGFSSPSPVRSDVPAALVKEAKVTLADARATALAQVPGGKVKSEELEREHGKLIYSFDIVVAGKPGVDEVNVNAIDGKIVDKSHESAKTEKAEERKEHHHKTPPRHKG
jgi:hypothetical protein